MKKRASALTSCLMVGATLAGCAGPQTSTRVVDNPSGKAVTYGKPKNTTYETVVDAARDFTNLVVYRSSRCDVLPVQVMQRYEETLEGDKVVHRKPINKTQKVGDPTGQIACDQTYARDVDVLLEVDGERFRLGKTDQRGEVKANLAQVFQVGSYDDVPDRAKIMLRPIQAQPLVEGGTLSMRQFQRQQERVTELLNKLEEILAKGDSPSSDEITRSYELYSQLQDIASGDPRVEALSARFWELFFDRKREEARQRMEKNLESLTEAKETLKVMGDAAIPIYVQAAVNSGVLNRRALEWSSLRLIRALRGAPAICATGFGFGQVGSYGWPPDARLAAQYLNYGYGPGYAASINAACARF